MVWRQWCRCFDRHAKYDETSAYQPFDFPAAPVLGDNNAVAALAKEHHLLDATTYGDVAVVRSLLASGGVDVNAVETRPTRMKGYSLLYCAAMNDSVEIVQRLLTAGANVHARNQDEDGETPLQIAIQFNHRHIAKLLLAAGADVNAHDNRGNRVVDFVVIKALRYQCEGETLELLRTLIAHGATWDDRCEALAELNGTQLSRAIAEHYRQQVRPTAPGTDHELLVATQLRSFALLWAAEKAQGLPLTKIPAEVMSRGAASGFAYVMDLAASKNVVFRRKICVVGASSAGKTSLIKSLTTDKPCLVHVDDRTIGIDHFSLAFTEEIESLQRTKRHDVTFWDFAGQDEYQVAHALFFSKRTLFLVCVDLAAYTIAFLQAELITDYDAHLERRMNEFMDQNVLRWIRVIFARQPSAEFVFVGTKHDVVSSGGQDASEGEAALEDLRRRLATVLQVVETMKQSLRTKQQTAEGKERSTTSKPMETLELQPQSLRLHDSSGQLILVSCTSQQSVAEAQAALREIITTSDRSFRMPKTYSQVLEIITTTRSQASATRKRTDERLVDLFVNVSTLTKQLQRKIPGLDATKCQFILQTLHDLGDVLWFEDVNDTTLRETVILDPLLLIDFVRQVITHKHTAETMPHATLNRLPFWVNLGMDEMLAMKKLLQHFHLVHPTDGEMAADSDLIVPTYWRSNTRALWLFGGDQLSLAAENTGTEVVSPRVRVHWEFHFVNEFPVALFDHLVVESYSPQYERDAGPDWILYQETDVNGNPVSACRVVVGRDDATHQPTLHVEAVLSEQADQDQTTELWETFEHVCAALALVLSEFPGLVVTSFAWDPQCTKPNLRSLVASRFKSRKWMPPKATLIKCRDLLTSHKKPPGWMDAKLLLKSQA